MNRLICKINKDGKHYGNVKCVVCSKKYDWVEYLNADVEVEYLSMDGYERFLDLKVTGKCPNCNYRCVYLYRIKDNGFK